MRKLTNQQYDKELREKIARGEITPEEAESEYDFYANGMDSYQNIYGM